MLIKKWPKFSTLVFYGLFFLAGCPALFYQLVWQRSLLNIYGSNIESVTIIVTAFMLGLGLGSILGGWISKYYAKNAVMIFGLLETGIGICGLLSIKAFAWLNELTLAMPHNSLLWLFLIGLCIPTSLMGASLPLLVTYLTRQHSNVGRNVGILYFVNTAGAATACLIVAFWAMHALGQQGVITLAASINFLIAGVVLLLAFSTKKIAADSKIPNNDDTLHSPSHIYEYIPFKWAIILVGLTGYLALSYEIIWLRIFSFYSATSAWVFALVLSLYLLGLAAGAYVSRAYCLSLLSEKTFTKILNVLKFTLVTAIILSFLFIPIVAYLVQYVDFVVCLIILATITMLFGFNLPLISHLAVKPDKFTGQHLSYLYFSNTLGSTFGCLITGLFLLNIGTIAQINWWLLCVGLFCIGIVLKTSSQNKTTKFKEFAGLLLLALFFYVSKDYFYFNIYEKLLFKNLYHPDLKFAHVVENRHGVITVASNDIVFGGGAYDGSVNTDIHHMQNMIIRAYAISAFHPAPKKVLMIGLSSGSWAQVLANHPQLEELTIVEINPGYLSIIDKYPQVASILNNPKVKIIIDDGRRWLAKHQEQRYDLIVMNTTFHWREHASNLLSKEFLQMVSHVLTPNGVLYYNTTDSNSVIKTALQIFPYALRIFNLIAVSKQPLKIDTRHWSKIILNYKIANKSVFDFGRKQDKDLFNNILEWLHTIPIYPKQSIYIPNSTSVARIITDDNMGSEWPGFNEPWPVLRIKVSNVHR